MGIFSWFSKPSAPDYETLLSRLSTEINDAKVHLSEIRLRERRSALLISLYGLGLWALWAGLWWVGGLPFGLLGWDREGMEVKVLGASGVGIGPIFIWGLNRLLGMYFSRQRHAEEKHLRKLLAEQRKQLDAIKKATNYDSTRKLIELYDEHSPASASPSPQQLPQRQKQVSSNPVTPVRQGQAPVPGLGTGPSKPSPKGTPRAPGHLVGVGGTPQAGTPGQEGMTAEQAAALHLHMQAIQPVLPTPEKKWYDRVVDGILGDDPSPQSKYALVCGECFRHNGLVGGKYEWERMQWICPRCNHMNLPPISKPGSGSGSGAPSTPSASAFQPAPAGMGSAPTTPSHKPLHPAPRPRRGLSDRGTPRSSKLQEVFSAADEDDEEEEGEGGGGDDRMDVDEHK